MLIEGTQTTITDVFEDRIAAGKNQVSKIKFTHKIAVPNNKAKIETADGYAEEMEDVKIFMLSQEEHDDLRKIGGLFELFDKTFGTIIDDCEEDRLSSDQVIQALEIARRFREEQASSTASGLDKVIHSLEYAKKIGAFWAIINGSELFE